MNRLVTPLLEVCSCLDHMEVSVQPVGDTSLADVCSYHCLEQQFGETPWLHSRLPDSLVVSCCKITIWIWRLQRSSFAFHHSPVTESLQLSNSVMLRKLKFLYSLAPHSSSAWCLDGTRLCSPLVRTVTLFGIQRSHSGLLCGWPSS